MNFDPLQIQYKKSDNTLYILSSNEVVDKKNYRESILKNFKTVFQEIDCSLIKFEYLESPISSKSGKILFRLPDII